MTVTDFQTENNQESIQIMVAEDQLSASVWIQQGESHYTAALLKNRLSEAGVTSGLQEETIQQLANGCCMSMGCCCEGNALREWRRWLV